MKKGILFVVMALLVSMPILGHAVTFGEQGTGTSQTGFVGYANLCQFTCPSNGTINRIRAYMSQASSTIRVAVYANAGTNQPGVLLVESSSQTCVVGWNTFVIPSTAVSAGATYWLAIQANSGSALIRYYSGSANQNALFTDSLYGSFSSDYSGVSPAFRGVPRLCMYVYDVATPTPSGTPTPTFTITETFTQTPSQTPTYTPTPTSTITQTATETPTLTHSATMTVTPTVTPTDTPTGTATITQTSTITLTATPTPTITFTGTITETATITQTATITPTSTMSPTFTISPTATVTPTVTATPTITETPLPLADKVTKDDVLVYPQPARDQARLAYTLEGQGTINVDVFNATGERVLHLAESALNQGGAGVTQLATQALGPGIYYVVLTIEDDSGKRQIKKRIAIVE